jgi:hypothetical protein
LRASAAVFVFLVTTTANAAVPAALPLAVLEAMQGLDAPAPDALDEFHGELSAKRLGLNRTVAAEIARLERLGRRRAKVPVGELTALLRLAGRRSDAALVFTEAGRRAARRAAKRVSARTRLMLRALPGALRHRLGFAVARRVAAEVFEVRLARDHGVPNARFVDRATPLVDGAAVCALLGSGIAELLRLFTDFDGAMLHVTCRTRGDAACAWRATSAQD